MQIFNAHRTKLHLTVNRFAPIFYLGIFTIFAKVSFLKTIHLPENRIL